MDYIPQSPYERMKPLRDSAQLRLNTFSNWPVEAPVSPTDLVRDCFYYIGIEDKCQCTHCGGVLGGWRQGDNVRREHRKHFPDCPFIRSQIQSGNQSGFAFSAAGTPINEPMETSQSQRQEDQPGVNRPKYREYSLEQTRLSSFTGWPSQMKQKPEILAKAGFFYLGQGDKVKCFYCGGILWDWDPEDEPYTEHAKWFPKCPWLTLSKGNPFIEKVQNDLKKVSISNGSPAEETSVKSVEETQPKRLTNSPASTPSTSTAESSSSTNKNYYSESQLNDTEHLNVREVIEENRRIKEERQCKICMDEDVSVVFLPCGHLACCPKCAVPLDKCPICRKNIEKHVKIYW